MSTGTEEIFLPDSASKLPHRIDMMSSMKPGNGAPTVNTTNLENVSDFSKVCRVCATVTELVVPIYGEEGLRINLADKINKHLPIKVMENDVLPLVVCYQCTSSILATHELVACSLQADAALRTARAQRERQAQQPPQRQEEALDTEGIVEDRPDNYRRCEFCPYVVLLDLYNTHLLGRHADLVFHCDECNSYVPWRDFLTHMTHHARQYDAKGRRRAPKPFSGPPYPLLAPVPAPRAPRAVPAAADSTSASPADYECGPPRRHHLDRPTRNAAVQTIATAEPDPEPVLSRSVSIDDTVDDPGPARPDRPESNAEVAETDECTPGEKRPAVRQCPHCPKTYTASSSYFYHLKYTHGKSREHECPTCGRRFGTRGALREHASLHELTRSYQCERCEKRFRTKAGQYIHAQTHKDEKQKKFKCAECGRAFRWRAELKRHATRHAANRTHACECGRAFSVRADLLRHARTHKRAAHACPQAGCRATFAQPRYLRAHVARKHAAAA